MRPDWRDVAKVRESRLGQPRDEAAERQTVADLTQRLEQAEPMSQAEEAGLGANDHDYFVFQRRVPTTKGKWRMVSKEVEEAADE